MALLSFQRTISPFDGRGASDGNDWGNGWGDATVRCEVCKESAPVVYDVERQYGDKVNFVMLNIDNTKWGGEMDQYGVDGIPHIVFLDGRGASEGQVVGKFPKQALEVRLEVNRVSPTTRSQPSLNFFI